MLIIVECKDCRTCINICALRTIEKQTVHYCGSYSNKKTSIILNKEEKSLNGRASTDNCN